MNYLEANTKTMTSREIAAVVEKRHDVVKLSIERLVAKGVISSPPMVDFKNINNVTGAEYLVCKRDSYVIVAQLSPEFTARLVDRWQELEAQQAAPAPRELTRPFTLQDGLFAQHPQTPSDATLFTHEGVLMAYSPSTGIAYRQLPTSKRWKLITSGTLNKIYTHVKINGKMQALHRIIAQHFLNNGVPLSNEQHIDHREHADGSHTQDRLANLRIVTPQENHQNQKDASSKFAGVYWDKTSSKWRSLIWLNGNRKYLGRFASEHEAALAYIQACQANGLPCQVAIERFAANCMLLAA